MYATKDRGVNAPNSIGPNGLGAAYGWRAGGNRPGVRLGVTVGLVGIGIDPDIYVQFPAKWLKTMDAGIGFAASTPSNSTLPYIQLGRISERGNGLHAMFGFVSQNGPGGYLNPTGDGWLETMAYQFARKKLIWHVFATGIAGRRYPSDCGRDDCATLRKPRVLMLGVIFEEKFAWLVIPKR